MRKLLVLLFLGALALLLVGCAPGPNELSNTASPNGFVPSFWQGLWNGVIAPVTLVVSLFKKGVQMYEVHNNGGWYNLGFLLGIIAVWGGGAGGAAARRSRG
jgi:hypothetical protein